MAIEISTTPILKPPRITLYGVEGIGKSDFGANSNKPIFIPVEDGVDSLSVPKFNQPKDIQEVHEYLDYLTKENHDFKTVVIDSADWLERLIHKKICSKRNIKNIEDIPYGKGFSFALDEWHDILKKLDELRNIKNMSPVFLAHAKIERYNSPETDPYDRYQLKIHKSASALISEWSDMVLFANYKVFTTETDIGFGKKITRGTGGSYRCLYTIEKPAFKAKHRGCTLPPELPFEKGESWSELIKAYKENNCQ